MKRKASKHPQINIDISPKRKYLMVCYTLQGWSKSKKVKSLSRLGRYITQPGACHFYQPSNEILLVLTARQKSITFDECGFKISNFHPPSSRRGAFPRSASAACPLCGPSSSSPAVGTGSSSRGAQRDTPIPPPGNLRIRSRAAAAAVALVAVVPSGPPTVAIFRDYEREHFFIKERAE